MLNDQHKIDAKKSMLKELIKEMYSMMFKGKGQAPEEGAPAEESAESPKMESLEKGLGIDGDGVSKPDMQAKDDAQAPADGQDSPDAFKEYVKGEMKKGGKLKMPMKTTAMSVRMAVKAKPAAKKYG